jgi:iron complex outermembrane recepter protein
MIISRPGTWMYFLISGLLLFLSLAADATGTLSGKVCRSVDSIPLAGAHVRIGGTKLGVVTDKNGGFHFTGIQPGDYSLHVSFMGFKEEEKKVRVTDNKTVMVNFFLVSSTIESSEIEITGRKTEKNILEIPMRINMITYENIRNNPGQTVPQILDNLSGVNFTNTMGIYSNNNVVSMRGLSGDDQGRTLVLLDDVPINKADEGTVNWHLINRENIDQISVIKGPGSVVYGSNAMGGIINIRTHVPDKVISGTAAVEYGTYNTFNGRYFIAGKIKKQKESARGFIYNLNGFYTRSDGYNAEIPEYLEPGDTFTVNTFVREADIGAKLGYQFNAGSQLDISCNFYNDKRGRGEQIYEIDGAYERHNSWQTAAHYYGEKGLFRWKMHAYNLTEYFERLNEFMSEAEYNLYLVKSTRSDRGGLFTLAAGPWKHNVFTAGFEARLGSVDGQDIYYTSTDLISNSGRIENYGLFLQDELSLFNGKIDITAGVRLDYALFHDGKFTVEYPSYSIEYMMHYQDTLIPAHHWMQLDPKLSVQYRFTPTDRIYLSASRGFRAPILDDLCRTGKIHSGFKIANPDLNPEYIDNYEVGADLMFWKKVHFAPTVFYSIGHDFMYYVSTGDSVNMGYRIAPVFQKRNISRVDIFGVELDLGIDPFPWLSLFANYTHAHSQIVSYTVSNPLVDVDLSGKFLTDVPANKYAAGITWKNKIVSCSAIWKYVGARWINDQNEPDPVLLYSKFPPYNTFGFRAWHVFFNRLRVALNVDNIFDLVYVDDKLQKSPGRIITGEIEIQF